MGFRGGAVVKNPPAKAKNAGDLSSTPGSRSSSGEGNATHSSILAWKIPRAEKPGGLTVPGVAKESDTTDHTHTCLMR